MVLVVCFILFLSLMRIFYRVAKGGHTMDHAEDFRANEKVLRYKLFSYCIEITQTLMLYRK